MQRRLGGSGRLVEENMEAGEISSNIAYGRMGFKRINMKPIKAYFEELISNIPFILIIVLIIIILKVALSVNSTTPSCPGDDLYCSQIEEDEKYWGEVGR